MNDMESSGRIISMRNTFIIVYTILAGLIFALTCVYFIRSDFSSLLAQAENYTFSAAQQSTKNIENYCANIERAQYVVYEDPRFSTFFPADQIPTEEEQQTLNTLTDLFTKASYLGDYADIGIIYRNGLTAGIVTQTTKDMLGANVFPHAISRLKGGGSSWAVLYDKNVSCACYFKRINQDAVFIASFYISKLGNVFSKMGESSLMIYVADKDDKIIFSTDNAPRTTGERVDFELVNRFQGTKNVTIGDRAGAATLLTLNNGWQIYAAAYPGKSDRFGSGADESYILIIGLSLIIVFISAGVFISTFYTMKKRKKLLVEDRLDSKTGALTAFYFEEEVSDQIETALIGGTWSFSKVVIRDQEDISQRLGKDFIVGGLAKLTKLLRSHFGEKSIIGINDEDEITVFTDFSDFDIFKAHNDLRIKHEECAVLFKQLLVGDDEDYKLNVAVGACIYPDDGNDFDELDYKAGMALSEALKLEGDSIVFYDGKSRSGVSGS